MNILMDEALADAIDGTEECYKMKNCILDFSNSEYDWLQISKRL